MNKDLCIEDDMVDFASFLLYDSHGVIAHRHESFQEYLARGRLFLGQVLWQEQGDISSVNSNGLLEEVLKDINDRYGMFLDWVPIKWGTTPWYTWLYNAPAYCLANISGHFIDYVLVVVAKDCWNSTLLSYLGYVPKYILMHEFIHVGRIQLIGDPGDYDEIFSSLFSRTWWHVFLIAGYDLFIGKALLLCGYALSLTMMLFGHMILGMICFVVSSLSVLYIGWSMYVRLCKCADILEKVVKSKDKAWHLLYRLYTDEIQSILEEGENTHNVWKNIFPLWRRHCLKWKYAADIYSKMMHS